MVEVIEVKSRSDRREFVELPLRMYKDCPYFVPELYGDVMKLLKDGGKTDIADSAFFIAKKDGVTVGRIQAILHRQYNELKGERRVRFTRFDSVNDTEVSRALFGAVESWARERGMTELCGPLGYSDLDREGLLIEGFDENSTYEEEYSYDYYPALVEDYGFAKEIDWLEFVLTAPEKPNPMLKRVADRALEMNKLHIADTNMPKPKYLAKYQESFFDTLDVCYAKLYGTMPITEAERRELISQFNMIINVEYTVFICDGDEKVVAFGLCFPSIGDALKKSGGRLTIPAIIRLLRAAKNPETLDLGLVAVRPEYQNSGVNAVILNGLIEMLSNGKIKSCETNLNLETNTQVMAQWKHLTSRQHKRRRAYLKNITESENNNA